MTSVPKPLKFLRPHYEELGKLRETWDEGLKDPRVSGLRFAEYGDLFMQFRSSHSLPRSSLSLL